jgi:phage gp46-like protein
MTTVQQGDVTLFQALDGGEITLTDGIVSMSGGLSTSATLALFGGNENDTGARDDRAQWWGNALETDPSFAYRSETQHLLRSLNASTGNLKRVQKAAERDLKYLVDIKAASSISVEVSMPELNKIKISCSINAFGREENFEFVENWGSQP